jgi:hypothetical protein
MARKPACLSYRRIKHGRQCVDKGTEYFDVHSPNALKGLEFK